MNTHTHTHIYIYIERDRHADACMYSHIVQPTYLHIYIICCCFWGFLCVLFVIKKEFIYQITFHYIFKVSCIVYFCQVEAGVTRDPNRLIKPTQGWKQRLKEIGPSGSGPVLHMPHR